MICLSMAVGIVHTVTGLHAGTAGIRVARCQILGARFFKLCKDEESIATHVEHVTVTARWAAGGCVGRVPNNGADRAPVFI